MSVSKIGCKADQVDLDTIRCVIKEDGSIRMVGTVEPMDKSIESFPPVTMLEIAEVVGLFNGVITHYFGNSKEMDIVFEQSKKMNDLMLKLAWENGRLRAREEVFTSNEYTKAVTTAAVDAYVAKLECVKIDKTSTVDKDVPAADVRAAPVAAKAAPVADVVAPAATKAASKAARKGASKAAAKAASVASDADTVVAVPAAKAVTKADSTAVPVVAPVVPKSVPVVAAPAVSKSAPVVPSVVPVAVGPIRTTMPKPVETWSLVVRGKKGVTSKEVYDKVVKEVGPTLGVRVYDMKSMDNGDTVIRVPSMVERDKVVGNAKFKEIGLEVLVNERPGPRIVVCGVNSNISIDEFMTEVYEKNLKEIMTFKQFTRRVHLVKPWKSDAGEVNVVLEGDEVSMRHILENGRLYILWFHYKVRLQDAIPHCFRCLGFDHRVRDCRKREVVCRLCGVGGHLANRCTNAVNCRNCASRGLPADHCMVSYACPVYAALVARADARH